jgi:hypothetical protein
MHKVKSGASFGNTATPEALFTFNFELLLHPTLS